MTKKLHYDVKCKQNTHEQLSVSDAHIQTSHLINLLTQTHMYINMNDKLSLLVMDTDGWMNRKCLLSC